MEEKLKKLEHENENQYIARLYKNKIEYGVTNKEVTEILNKELNKSLAESTYRSIAYPYNDGFEDGYEKALSEFKNDKILDEYEIKKLELEKERKKIQTVSIEYNKLLRQDARIELYLEKIEESILTLSPLNIPEHKVEKDNEKTALVNIADAHVGKSGVVKGLRGEIINTYNFDVFKERMWRIFNDTLKIIEKEELTNIKLLTLGDMIEGILRYSQLQSLEMGVVDSIIQYSDFMSQWINELSKYVYVDYYSAYGNHDGLRLLQAKSAHDFPHENVGRLIDFYLSKRLESNPNVKINDNQLPYSYFEVFGMNILAMHGEEKDLVNAVKDFKVMYDERVDMFITGHLHKEKIETAGLSPFGDIEVIRIPSLCGIDDFSVTIKKFSRAGAKIFILEKGKGKTITYDIKIF